MPTKTAFSTKCSILGTLWTFYKDTEIESWREFFDWADIGLPLAYQVQQELATAKPEGKEIVEETWKVFCQMIEIDPDGKYADLAAAFAASPQPEVG